MRKIFITPNVKAFMEQVDDKTRAKINSVLSYLTDNKNPLREPYVKHISISKYKELYELRVKVSGESQGLFSPSRKKILFFSMLSKRNATEIIPGLLNGLLR